MPQPTSYQCLRTIIEHFEASLRFILTQRLPSINVFEKLISLKIKHLELNKDFIMVNGRGPFPLGVLEGRNYITRVMSLEVYPKVPRHLKFQVNRLKLKRQKDGFELLHKILTPTSFPLESITTNTIRHKDHSFLKSSTKEIIVWGYEKIVGIPDWKFKRVHFLQAQSFELFHDILSAWMDQQNEIGTHFSFQFNWRDVITALTCWNMLQHFEEVIGGRLKEFGSDEYRECLIVPIDNQKEINIYGSKKISEDVEISKDKGQNPFAGDKYIEYGIVLNMRIRERGFAEIVEDEIVEDVNMEDQ